MAPKGKDKRNEGRENIQLQNPLTKVSNLRTFVWAQLQTVEKNEILNHRIHPCSFRQTSSHWVTFYFGFQARFDGCSYMHFHRILLSTHVTCEQGTVQCPFKMGSTSFHSRHQSRLSCPRTCAAVQSAPWKPSPDLWKLHFTPRNGQKKFSVSHCCYGYTNHTMHGRELLPNFLTPNLKNWVSNYVDALPTCAILEVARLIVGSSLSWPCAYLLAITSRILTNPCSHSDATTATNCRASCEWSVACPVAIW